MANATHFSFIAQELDDMNNYGNNLSEIYIYLGYF